MRGGSPPRSPFPWLDTGVISAPREVGHEPEQRIESALAGDDHEDHCSEEEQRRGAEEGRRAPEGRRAEGDGPREAEGGGAQEGTAALAGA
jgi:hypothetical protein